jgi:hypothetical protein
VLSIEQDVEKDFQSLLGAVQEPGEQSTSTDGWSVRATWATDELDDLAGGEMHADLFAAAPVQFQSQPMLTGSDWKVERLTLCDKSRPLAVDENPVLPNFVAASS